MHLIVIIIDLNTSTIKDRSSRSCFHKEEVNKPKGTLETRFYTLLLQPRRRIYLIQDSFCCTGIENLQLRAIKAMASSP